MAEVRRCWCGSGELAPFDNLYLSCQSCESLVVATPPEGDPTRVRDDDGDFYGRRYWFEHQQELGQPDLEARSLTDLSERCLHWLQTLLKYRSPPGRTLELGCSHGGFVHLLAGCGFEASGLELSPWVVDFASSTFEVPVRLGPIEDQDIEPGSLDVIVAMDVLEHLPEPETTLRRCAELLSDDGIFLIQTPCRPAGKSYEDLADAEDRFLEMLLPTEHLYLFSRQAAGELLKRVGASHQAFEPAIFDHYDMFLVAGSEPLQARSETAVWEELAKTASGRRILALLDLHRRAEDHAKSFRQADRDRGDRQRQIDELHGLLESDRDDRRQSEDLLRQEIDRLQDERTKSQQQIELLEREQTQSRQTVERLDAERTEMAAAIEELEEELTRALATTDEMAAAIAKLDEDRALAQRTAEELRQQRDTFEHETTRLQAAVAEKAANVRRLREDVDDLQQRHDELSDVHRRAVGTIEAQDAVHAELARDAERLRHRGKSLERHVRGLREVIDEHRTSRIYRTLVGLGRWRAHDDKVQRTLAGDEEPPEIDSAAEVIWRLEATSEPEADAGARQTIAVDLTALLPGGENGGAKLVAMALVRQLSRLSPERELVLLTSEPCHEELGALDAENVRRLQVGPEPAALGDVLQSQPLHLLLCPMTAPPFADPRVPSICVVHDLQYQVYPEFFRSEERAVRDRDFRRAVETADRIVTVSEYVRGTVLESSDLDPSRVVAIHNGLAQRLPEIDDDRVDEILAEHDLERGRFLLYPANFWPHKNHRMLLVAFGRLRHRHPDSDLRLVLTGAERPDPGPLVDAARDMGLGDAVVIPGFVSTEELAALMRSCLALIFPSLYEGFGIPLVEAMACGRPVLASNVASIPEVAGDAALLFDPRKPEEITAAIESLLDEPDLATALGEKGPAHANRIANVERMARAYLKVIDEVLESPRPPRDGLFGVHGDGWTGRRFVIGYGTAPDPSPPSPLPHPPSASAPGEGRPLATLEVQPLETRPPLSRAGVKGGRERGARGVRGPIRTLEMELASPPGSAAHPVTLSAKSSGGEHRRITFGEHPVLRLRCQLPPEPGWIELEVEPAFIPRDRGVNDDGRELGLKLSRCLLTGDDGDVDLLAGIRA